MTVSFQTAKPWLQYHRSFLLRRYQIENEKAKERYNLVLERIRQAAAKPETQERFTGIVISASLPSNAYAISARHSVYKKHNAPPNSAPSFAAA